MSVYIFNNKIGEKDKKNTLKGWAIPYFAFPDEMTVDKLDSRKSVLVERKDLREEIGKYLKLRKDQDFLVVDQYFKGKKLSSLIKNLISLSQKIWTNIQT